VDEMDKPAWSPGLMDWLAEDLVAHQYDLKQTMARILTSRAYQLPAVNLAETDEHFVFHGPGVRRLNAEEFTDAIMHLAGLNYPENNSRMNRTAALLPPTTLPLQPKWIWATANAQVTARPATVVFERKVTLAAAPTDAFLTLAADNSYDLTVNGKKIAASSKRTCTVTETFDLKPALQTGENTINVKAVNYLADGTSPIPITAAAAGNAPTPVEGDTPAGLILYARIRAGDTIMDVASDSAWSAQVEQEQAAPAVELGDVELAPWKLGAHFLELAAAHRDTLPVQRASLVAADPLMAALGRPNREQIMTVRQGLATTLQALELTNGHTLAVLLKQAADQLLTQSSADTGALVTTLYQKALSRSPQPKELTAATQLVGSPAQTEGVQDLLWSLAMLPEFQLIK
jgi:hypothetical protein